MAQTIRPVQAADRGRWDELYAAYAVFYQVPQTAQMRDTVWGWLMDPQHTTEGLVAARDGRLIGLAHFRPFARPLTASTGGFLDDLFLETQARGQGAAEALIDAVRATGVARGWSVIRWITAEDNARARGVYDKVAAQTAWVTYDIKI